MQSSEKESEVEVKNSIMDEISGGPKGKVYELGYLLVPTTREEEVPTSHANLKDLVLSLKGEVIGDEIPKMINLAYTMLKVTSNVRNKFNTAYFGWIKFTMEGEKVIELKKNLDLNPSIIRFLILKTVKENTIAAKRFVRGETYTRKPKIKDGDGEVVIPVNKEEMDKEIDALVV